MKPKKYVALLNQSGTDAPISSVLENSLGGEVVWTREDVGVYFGTLEGAFTPGRTVAFVTHGSAQGDFDFSAACVAQGNTITLYTFNTTAPAVDGFEYLSLEVRVYPESAEPIAPLTSNDPDDIMVAVNALIEHANLSRQG